VHISFIRGNLEQIHAGWEIIELNLRLASVLLSGPTLQHFSLYIKKLDVYYLAFFQF
jgi:hypothetical protein